MKDIQDILRSLNVKNVITGETLYSFIEFRRVMEELCDENIQIHDCIITPYYFSKGIRMELYEYELNIRLVEKLDFEKYLLTKTGKRKVKDISKDVVSLQKNCYIELLKTNCEISKKRIQKYIDYLYNNNDLKNQVKQTFGVFNKENLLFEVY